MKIKIHWLIVMLFLFVLIGHTSAQKIGIKTNLLYDVTTTMNLGVEVGLGDNTSLDLHISYNPFTFSDNKKMKHILIQPELRWWMTERFNGAFIGIHTHYSYYNVGGIGIMGFTPSFLKKYRYQGWLLGTGVSYGYHWVFESCWALEASIGLGYAYMNYDKYKYDKKLCPTCGEMVGNQTKHYFGPTKAFISLIYMIK